MPEIPAFLCNQPVFDPETASAMVGAFLKLCRELNLESDPQAKEALAEKILEFAQRGEHDAGRLQDKVLMERNRILSFTGFRRRGSRVPTP